MERLIVKRQITYSCIFPEGKDDLKDLLKDIPSKSAIAWLSDLLFKMDMRSRNHNELNFFKPLLNYMNTKLHNEITNYLNMISNDIRSWVFIDRPSLLMLIEYILENHNDSDGDVLQSKDDFSNLFIAYLICCDERILYSTQELLNIKDAESQVLHHLPEQLKINDIVYPKDYRVEFIRFYYFMIFCKEDLDFREYLKIFLQENKIKKWEDYLYFVFSTYLQNVTNEEGASNFIQIDPDKYYGKKFLDSMSINVKGFKRELDFKELRSKPVYYHGNNLYSIISYKFFIDKMYQGLLFDLAFILKAKGKIKNYPQLKQLVGERFTENYLFYEIMQGCFSENYKKLISGENLKKHFGEGGPDFYIKKGKNIFLFEFKDVMLNGDTKHCGDLEKIKFDFLQNYELATIEKSNGKKKNKAQAKGVTQLLNVLENYLHKIIEKEDRIEIIDQLNVYPIIVYIDPSFDIEGFGYWLNNKFEELKQERVIPNDYLIKECVMIPLEIFIKLEDYFNDGRLQLHNLIDGYVIERKKSEQNKLFPFMKYVMRQARLKGYNEQMSSRFREISESILVK